MYYHFRLYTLHDDMILVQCLCLLLIYTSSLENGFAITITTDSTKIEMICQLFTRNKSKQIVCVN